MDSLAVPEILEIIRKVRNTPGANERTPRLVLFNPSAENPVLTLTLPCPSVALKQGFKALNLF